MSKRNVGPAVFVIVRNAVGRRWFWTGADWSANARRAACWMTAESAVDTFDVHAKDPRWSYHFSTAKLSRSVRPWGKR